MHPIDYQRFFGAPETGPGAATEAPPAPPAATLRPTPAAGSAAVAPSLPTPARASVVIPPAPAAPSIAQAAAEPAAPRLPDLAALEVEHRVLEPRAERFARELARQLTTLLGPAGVALSVPIQTRVKPWASVADRAARQTPAVESVTQLADFVGLRVIVPFRRDLATVERLLDEHFTVLERQPAGDGDGALDAVGYPSGHVVVTLPAAWLTVPTLADLRGWRAEVQLRTAAQQAWASAAHALQYQQGEGAMPAPVRRVMARVATFLETADLELERALAERERYRDPAARPPVGEPLNVDLLERVLDDLWPAEHKRAAGEPYGELLEDLRRFGVGDARALRLLMRRYRDAALAEDARTAQTRRAAPDAALLPTAERERLARGVYCTHAGLTRWVLGREFGREFLSYVRHAMHERSPRAPDVPRSDAARSDVG
jgi:ppGpp synthetase/RelA/SpoT-type nucleotidyltranferase